MLNDRWHLEQRSRSMTGLRGKDSNDERADTEDEDEAVLWEQVDAFLGEDFWTGCVAGRREA